MFPKSKSKLIESIKQFSDTQILSYSSDRNFDYGTPHKNVSRLSPYLRRRFISEYEVLKIILNKHKYENIEKPKIIKTITPRVKVILFLLLLINSSDLLRVSFNASLFSIGSISSFSFLGFLILTMINYSFKNG